ncbi:hypothetical protein RRG08_059098 [Elysia crispata]|uniref:Uncharacterized protein n=1 Tax=Elysia crispata TaxID=231223 RepID=A0AAE1B880_9GAST|nr:hypothetical protein RRG08_059098 [Elysia crispata]
MATLLKSGIVIFLMTLTLATTQQTERERRFVLDNIVSGAKALQNGVTGSFYRVTGYQLVKDERGTLWVAEKLSNLGDKIINKHFSLSAIQYRLSLIHKDAHRHLKEWESAVRLITQLDDQMIYSGGDLISSTNWIEKNIDYIPKSSDDAAETKVDLEISLRNIRLAIERLETLIPEVRAALTSLKDVTVADVTKDIEETLQKVTKTEAILKKARVHCDSLDNAVGLND